MRAAEHLGDLLTESEPRPPIARDQYADVVSRVRAWQEEMVHVGARQHAGSALAAGGAAVVTTALTDLQVEFVEAKEQLLAARAQLPAAKAVIRDTDAD